jgi:hypothetical protein
MAEGLIVVTASGSVNEVEAAANKRTAITTFNMG